LAESRSQAQRLIMAGQVRVGGERVMKPSQRVPPEAELVVLAPPRYVSRGGEKLAAALQAFGIEVRGAVCADVGASTGGFTDCLLQAGAARVYAIDVGHGLLHWKLRADPRVVLMERTNARYLERLPEAVDFVSVDVSFISLRLILPAVRRWLKAGGQVVALVKPQFEAGREQVGRKGVVRDVDVHKQVLIRILGAARELGLGARGLIRSPLRGPKGNLEFLLWLVEGAPSLPERDLLEPALRPA